MKPYSKVSINYKDIPKSLYSNKIFAMTILKSNPLMFKYLSQELKDDNEVILSVKKPGLIICYLGHDKKSDISLCKQLIMKDITCIKYINIHINNDDFYKDIFKYVINSLPFYITYFPRPIITDEKYYMYYFSKTSIDKSNIREIPNQILTNEKCLIKIINIINNKSNKDELRGYIIVLFGQLVLHYPDDMIEYIIIQIMKLSDLGTIFIKYINTKTVTNNIFLQAAKIGIDSDIINIYESFIRSKSYNYIKNIITAIINSDKHNGDIIFDLLKCYPDTKELMNNINIEFVINIINYIGNKKSRQFLELYGSYYLNNEEVKQILKINDSTNWNYNFIKNNKNIIINEILCDSDIIFRLHDILSKENKNITEYFSQKELDLIRENIFNNIVVNTMDKYSSYNIFKRREKYLKMCGEYHKIYLPIFKNDKKFILDIFDKDKYTGNYLKKFKDIFFNVIENIYYNNNNIIMKCITASKNYHPLAELVKKIVNDNKITNEKILLACIKNNINISNLPNNKKIDNAIIIYGNHKRLGDEGYDNYIDVCANHAEKNDSLYLHKLPEDYQNIKPVARAIYRNEGALSRIKNKEMQQYIIDINNIDRNILKYIENNRCINIAMIANCNIIKKIYETFIMALSKKKLFLDINMHSNIIKYIHVSDIIYC